jgi:peroxiredoxin
MSPGRALIAGRRSQILNILQLALLLAVFGCQQPLSPGEGAAGVEVGQAFRSFELRNLNGEEKNLEDYLARVTLVTFCFPTCGPCNAELPYFQRFHDTYSQRGLAVVAINVIPEQDSLVADWRAEKGFAFPVLVGADSGRLIEDYRLTATPLTFLIDSQGLVLARFDGYRPGQETEIEERIREELGAGIKGLGAGG